MTEPAQEPPRIVVELGELPRPVSVAGLFGREGPLVLEVGFGSGIWLATVAPMHPGTNFLGLERDRTQVLRTREKLEKRGIANVRLVCCDAPYFLEDYLPGGAVSECHIYFSDPWPKKRHHKRRLFSPRLLPILERILAPGAPLHIKTDVTAYHEVMVALLDSAPFLAKEWDRRLDLAPMPGDIVTNFQRKAIVAGHPIHAMLYRRRAWAPPQPEDTPCPSSTA